MKALFSAGTLLIVLSLAQVQAQTNAAASASAPTPAPKPATILKPLIFHPPSGVSGDVLPVRVGGGSRGGSADDLSVEVLVPDQVALTTQAHPSLYWYQSKTAKTQCEVTVTEPKNPKPLLLLKTSKTTPPGIHAIRLSKFNIELKPNVVYRWSVAVVVDPGNRSQDIIANGVIQRIDPSLILPPNLPRLLNRTNPPSMPKTASGMMRFNPSPIRSTTPLMTPPFARSATASSSKWGWMA